MDDMARWYAVTDEFVRYMTRFWEPGAIAHIQSFLDHGEEGLALDLVATLLLFERTPLTPAQRDSFADLVEGWGVDPADVAPTLHDEAGLVAALNVIGEPVRPRGVPRLTGGHEPGTGRAFTTEFPAGWGTERIVAAAAVAVPALTLANGRTWATGHRDGVSVGVLHDEHGVRAIVPCEGPGVARNPGSTVRRELVGELLHDAITTALPRLLLTLRAQLSDAEYAALDQLRHAGEWEELADALTARVIASPVELSNLARSRLYTALMAFDVPVDGCAFLNDRDRILAGLPRWDPHTSTIDAARSS